MNLVGWFTIIAIIYISYIVRWYEFQIVKIPLKLPPLQNKIILIFRLIIFLVSLTNSSHQIEKNLGIWLTAEWFNNTLKSMTYGVFIVLWHFFSRVWWRWSWMQRLLNLLLVILMLLEFHEKSYSINRGHRWIFKRITDKLTLLFLKSMIFIKLICSQADSNKFINNNFSEQFKTSHLRIVFKSCLLTLVINLLNYYLFGFQ